MGSSGFYLGINYQKTFQEIETALRSGSMDKYEELLKTGKSILSVIKEDPMYVMPGVQEKYDNLSVLCYNLEVKIIQKPEENK